MASPAQLALVLKDIFPYPWLQIPGLLILVVPVIVLAILLYWAFHPDPLQRNVLAVAGMVFGITSTTFFCIWYVALPIAIAGLVLSVLGLTKSKMVKKGRGMATAGLVLSIITLVVGGLLAVYWR